MNQYVEHRVKPTGNENEALILAALPDFFEKPLEMMKKQSLITDFLANMFRQNSKKPEYLMFHLDASAGVGKSGRESDSVSL